MYALAGHTAPSRLGAASYRAYYYNVYFSQTHSAAQPGVTAFPRRTRHSDGKLVRPNTGDCGFPSQYTVGRPRRRRAAACLPALSGGVPGILLYSVRFDRAYSTHIILRGCLPPKAPPFRWKTRQAQYRPAMGFPLYTAGSGKEPQLNPTLARCGSIPSGILLYNG